MTQLNLAKGLALALGIATFVATFSQCGSEPTAAQSNGNGSNAANHSSTGQDPQPTPPKDTLHLLISGSMHGRLEPCGCASGQLGGLARRAQHIGERRNYDLLIEGGDIVSSNTELDTLKLWTASTVLFDMQQYDVLGVGLKDLAVDPANWREDWISFLAAAPVVATNIDCKIEGWPGKPYRDKQVRDFQVRTASLLLDDIPGDDPKLVRTDPEQAWQQAFQDTAPELFRIAMVHGNDAQTRALLPKLSPAPDLAICVDSAYIEPEGAPTMVDDIPLVFAGIRGRVLLDVQLWRENGKPRAVCELVPLAGSKTVPGGGGDPAVKDVLLEHRRTVKEMGVLKNMSEQRETPNGDAYIGSAACGGCHPTALAAWNKSKHSHAWQTLVDAENDPKRYGWPVTAYPDCVNCHVVGYGEKTGFVNAEETPHLKDVGCERCHGPGGGHMQSMGKKKMGIIGGEMKSQLCTQCHDFEQSPTFVYNERWEIIKHGKEPK